MDGITSLLARARKAGVLVEVDGDNLRIEGGPDNRSLAAELLRRKAEILPHLAGEPPVDELPPIAPFTWSDPQPLPGLPPVAPFDYALLPTSLRRWVADISERMQAPPDFAAVAAVVVLAALVGRKIAIRPKRRDDWTVVPNLWGAIVGRPSVMKTPALKEPLNVVKKLEIDAKKKHDGEALDAKAAELVEKARSKQRDKDVEAALKNGEDAHAVARSYLDEIEAAPRRTRYLVNDSTVEKIGEILADNPNGVLLFRDELVGFLKSLDREGQEGARTFFLESWNGDGRFAFDRIGRGTIDIESCCVSILGGIQPGPLQSYVRECSRGGRGDDGLLQRFQLLTWPDVSGDWKNVDRHPDDTARGIAHSMYERLVALDPLAIGAVPVEGKSPFLRFASDAQDLFDEWRSDLEHRLRSADDCDALTAHLAKYRSLVPTLALLFHLADDGRDEVTADATRRAIAWSKYLESHARRLYSQTDDTTLGPARALAAKIKAGALTDGFTLRCVYRPQWANLGERDEAAAAVDLLLELGWLAAAEVTTAGRPATTYKINPAVAKKSGKAPVDELTTLTKAPSVSVVSYPTGPSRISALDSWNDTPAATVDDDDLKPTSSGSATLKSPGWTTVEVEADQ